MGKLTPQGEAVGVRAGLKPRAKSKFVWLVEIVETGRRVFGNKGLTKMAVRDIIYKR